MFAFNALYHRRGLPFNLADYPPKIQTLIRSKLRDVDQLVWLFPKRFSCYATLALNAPRGLLRRLSIRDDFEAVTYYCALTVEPYPFLANPKVRMISLYLSKLDRFIASQMGKTISHIPKNFTQYSELLKVKGRLDYLLISAAPPDENGYLNLGVNSELIPETLDHYRKSGDVKIIAEINSHMPWVQGHEDFGGNRIHLSEVAYVYENHEPLTQLPIAVPSEAERVIGRYAMRYVEDGDTIQLGIGGVPNSLAENLKGRRELKIHSELLTDAVVDLVRAGAVDSRGKPYMDGYIVGTFATGTNKLYDWLDRNPEVMLLPIKQTNDPYKIGSIPRMKSINSALMVDLNGQICSDCIGFNQISGVGGQFEFVMGSQLSEGGRSIICLKSASKVKGQLQSNIVLTLPPGTSVTVPRQFADVIITEYGAAELRFANFAERAEALIAIAHPAFRGHLRREADRVGLLSWNEGFDTFKKRAIYNNFKFIYRLKNKLQDQPKSRVVWREVKALLNQKDLAAKAISFYRQNK